MIIFLGVVSYLIIGAIAMTAYGITYEMENKEAAKEIELAKALFLWPAVILLGIFIKILK